MKFIGRILIISGIAAFLGILLSVFTFTYALVTIEGKSEVTSYNTEYKTFSCDGNDIDKIDISVKSNKVSIEETDGKDLTVKYVDAKDKKNERFICKVSGKNTLVFEDTSSSMGINFSRGLVKVTSLKEIIQWIKGDKIKVTDDTVQILVPFSMSYEYEINSASGEVYVSVKNIEDIEINVASGRVSVMDSEINENLNIDTASGSVSLKNLLVNEKLTVNAASGAVGVENIEVKDQFSVESASGSLKGDMIKAEKFSYDTASGSLQVDLIDSEDISLNAVSGSMHTKLSGSISDYSIESDSVSGRNSLPSKYKGGNRKLDISTLSGSIDVTFED